jgi:PhzF family phenazine biosynthesis protein
VFTGVPLAGNGLAVVHDADALGDDAMLAFARETRLSETTFVQSATEDGATYRNRIWTVGRELVFAGHPSLGTAVAEARRRGFTAMRLVVAAGYGRARRFYEREGWAPASEEFYNPVPRLVVLEYRRTLR